MVRLCPQCGVVAPQRSQRCLLCELPLGANTLTRPTPPEGRMWASVWCWFRCPTCTLDVPVDDFTRERIPCPSCGTSYGLRGLRRAFEHAHAVADLAGPDPEGRFPDGRVSIAADNPFKAFGVLQSVSEDRHDELVIEDGVRRAALSIRVAPGHPLCDECNTPLTVTADDGTLSAHCTGCSACFRSRIAPAALAALDGAVGVLSTAHRDDRPEPVIERNADDALVRFRCPDCTSTLGDPLGRRTLTCEMCRLICVVPATHWRIRSGDAIPLQRAWVLFEGPSRLRDELIRQARRRAEHTVRTTSLHRTPSTTAGRQSPPPEPPRDASSSTRQELPSPDLRAAPEAPHKLSVDLLHRHTERRRRAAIRFAATAAFVLLVVTLATWIRR